MKTIAAICLLCGWQFATAQTTKRASPEFCHSLHQVFEYGKHGDFASLNSTMTKVSPLLPVPGYGIHLERFPTVYVDKDSRFVAKTDLNFDSLTAVKKVEDYKAYVGTCLDTTKWVWLEQQGDDSTTVFFKELKEWQAVSDTFTLSLAVTNVAHKVYSINMYIKRNDK